MMTTKSDDVDGRVRAYGAIVKGENLPPAGIPESFQGAVEGDAVPVAECRGAQTPRARPIDMKDEDDDPMSASDDLGFNIGARPDAAAKEGPGRRGARIPVIPRVAGHKPTGDPMNVKKHNFNRQEYKCWTSTHLTN